jgi:hypothetical protein
LHRSGYRDKKVVGVFVRFRAPPVESRKHIPAFCVVPYICNSSLTARAGGS